MTNPDSLPQSGGSYTLVSGKPVANAAATNPPAKPAPKSRRKPTAKPPAKSQKEA